LTTTDLIHIFFAKLGMLGANIVCVATSVRDENHKAKKPARSGSTKTWTTQLLLIELALLR
jgi:hypothetical protein